jgi:hypothetical protein
MFEVLFEEMVVLVYQYHTDESVNSVVVYNTT